MHLLLVYLKIVDCSTTIQVIIWARDGHLQQINEEGAGCSLFHILSLKTTILRPKFAKSPKIASKLIYH